MIFEGSLANFFPPDLLIFIAGLGKEGVLTLTENEMAFTITVKENSVTDAQSESADEKILKSLRVYGLLNEKTYKYLIQAQQETKLPVRQILEKLNLFANPNVKKLFLAGIREVIFQCFKLQNGYFKFTELDTGISDGLFCLNPQALAIELSGWVDEYKDLERELSTLTRHVSLAPGIEQFAKTEGIMAADIGGGISIKSLISRSSFPSYPALKLLKKMIDEKKVILQDISNEVLAAPALSKDESVFLEFKNSSREILTAGTFNDKLKGLLGFCKTFFNHFFVITMTHQELSLVMHFYKDKDRVLKRKKKEHIKTDAASEPVFKNVLEAGVPFFGKPFETRLLDGIAQVDSEDQCAILPLTRDTKAVRFVYILSKTQVAGSLPFKYLEVLYWMVNPSAGLTAQIPKDDAIERDGGRNHSKQENIDPLVRMADTVNDLPPMPHMATKILNYLSDPDYDVDKLVPLISQDQSIMAALIKISNSVLYRGMQEISTVREAVNRLGVKSIKSIIIAAATRTLFPSGESEFNLYAVPLWTHAKACGMISRRIAQISGSADPEEAFVAGILHDIGKLAVLMKDIDAYKRIKALQKKMNHSSVEAELKVIGYHHAQAGAFLMKKWNMPDSLVEPVEYHHWEGLASQGNPLACTVALGNFYSNAMEMDLEMALSRKSPMIDELLIILGFNPGEEASLIQAFTAVLEQADGFDV